MSVRDVAEAAAAHAGGADIIDVKEPSRGSLGRADEQVLDAIASMLASAHADTTISAALGEVGDRPPAEEYRVPESVRFAKLGLSQLAGDERWIERWVAVRNSFDHLRTTELNWVAVIYADGLPAQSPPGEEIIVAAANTGCVGVLVDTWSKSDGTLLDHVPVSRLIDWAERVRRANMFFALAGRLSPADLPRLDDVNADVIAVRSAVCRSHDRQASVETARVARLRREVNRMTVPPASSP